MGRKKNQTIDGGRKKPKVGMREVFSFQSQFSVAMLVFSFEC